MSGVKDNQMPETPDGLENEAALYALGVLDSESAARFEELLSRDAAAEAALRMYDSAAALLAESLEPVAPPPQLKQRLLERIQAAAAPHVDAPSLGAVRADEGKWKPAGVPGVTYKKLYLDRIAGLVTTLVRMEPGSVYPAHRHSRTEQCLVLEGDLIHDEHVYHPGDFTWAQAGTIDPMLRTEHGNLLFIISGEEDQRL